MSKKMRVLSAFVLTGILTLGMMCMAFAGTSGSTVTINQQVLVDQNNVRITALEYVTDRIWGDGIKILIENNLSQSISVGCKELIVNDYMITDLFSASVAAGKKSNEVIYLSSSELKASGIDTVGKIELYFTVYDPSTFQDIFETGAVTIKTSAYASMDTVPNDGGAVLYNKGGIKIVGKAVDKNSFWGTAIVFYCENNSGRNVTISASDVSINGYMMDPFFSMTVYNGKKAIDDMSIFSEDLKKNGITSINNVELRFNIYEEDTFRTIEETDVIRFSSK